MLPAKNKNFLTLSMLVFLLGMFGAHRFYVGRIESGVILLCCGMIIFLTNLLYFISLEFMEPAIFFGIVYLIVNYILGFGVFIFLSIDVISISSGNFKSVERYKIMPKNETENTVGIVCACLFFVAGLVLVPFV